MNSTESVFLMRLGKNGGNNFWHMDTLALELALLFLHNVPKMSNNPSIHAMQPQQNSCLHGAGSQEIVINVKRDMRKIYGKALSKKCSWYCLPLNSVATDPIPGFFNLKSILNIVSGWGIHVYPRLIHVNVWQKPLQFFFKMW